MKIIHTGDWHIGVELYGHDRSEEHREFFDRLVRLMSDERPDALVVSGDVFDRMLPSQAAQRIYLESLIRLHEASPTTEIVVTAGNHDSASRLEIYRKLWIPFQVHVVGYIERCGAEVNQGKHIIRIADKGFVVALPYTYPHNFPPVEDGGDRQRAFVDSLMAEVGRVNPEGLPIVLMAHLAVSGSDFVGHREEVMAMGAESRTMVGNLEVMTFDQLGDGYDYLALGHIHRPQVIRGSGGRAYYAGAPFAMSFDEDFEHSVYVVELEGRGLPKVTPVPIATRRRLRTLPEKPEPLDEVLRRLSAEIGAQEETLLRVNLAVDGSVPVDAEERIMGVLKSKPGCVLCQIKYTDSRELRANEPDRIEMYHAVRENNPMDVARQYMEAQGVSQEQRMEYESLLSEVWSALRREDEV